MVITKLSVAEADARAVAAVVEYGQNRLDRIKELREYVREKYGNLVDAQGNPTVVADLLMGISVTHQQGHMWCQALFRGTHYNVGTSSLSPGERYEGGTREIALATIDAAFKATGWKPKENSDG